MVQTEEPLISSLSMHPGAWVLNRFMGVCCCCCCCWFCLFWPKALGIQAQNLGIWDCQKQVPVFKFHLFLSEQVWQGLVRFICTFAFVLHIAWGHLWLPPTLTLEDLCVLHHGKIQSVVVSQAVPALKYRVRGL